MQVAFRADASAAIGAGHIMRCLTLADGLQQAGAVCTFVSRDMPPALALLVAEHGHIVRSISDGEDNLLAFVGETPDWLVVDQYGLDIRFERVMRTTVKKIMVIDDLADRAHDCDILLDQNLGRKAEDYNTLVPQHCRLLMGPKYALLRPDFAQFRAYSLRRRRASAVRHVLVSLGGFDSDNVTGLVLSALKSCSLPVDAKLSVVMGSDAPWIDDVRQLAKTMPWPTEILVGVRDMARLMAESDLAIGAAGGSAWERAALGLPVIILVVAENQRPGAHALEAAGAARLLSEDRPITETLCTELAAMMQPATLSATSRASAAITCGNGVNIVVTALLEAA